jgi:hypothetical protein
MKTKKQNKGKKVNKRNQIKLSSREIKELIRDFNYHVFVDYSLDHIGYIIVESKNLKGIMKLTRKLHHYSEIKHKDKYIKDILKNVKWKNIDSLIMRKNFVKLETDLKVIDEILGFIKENQGEIIFISISDHYYYSFMKLVELLEGNHNFLIVKKSDIKKDSFEYRLSLLLETELNLKRRKK